MNRYYFYYLELKNRLFLIALTWVSVSATCYTYKDLLVFTIVDNTYYAGFLKNNPYFIFSDVTDLFSAYLALIFFISIQVCFFIFLYHSLVFLSPGLYLFEYKNLAKVIPVSFCCWIFSISVLNLVIVPISWSFFLSFNKETNLISFVFEANLKKYLSYYIDLYYLCVLNFQFFFLLLLAVDSAGCTLTQIKKFRKLFYFLFILLSTVLTPPDVFSQMFVSLSFVSVYEFFVFLKVLNRVTL